MNVNDKVKWIGPAISITPHREEVAVVEPGAMGVVLWTDGERVNVQIDKVGWVLGLFDASNVKVI